MSKQFSYSELNSRLKPETNIVITTHRGPDGDAIGSSLGLYHILKKMGCNAQVIVPDRYPDFLKWMPGNETIFNFEDEPDLARKHLAEAELIFCLDFNVLSRIGNFEDDVDKSLTDKVMIDHHREPDDFAKYTISDPEASSTAQLIYEFAENTGNLDKIDLNVASCLYTGMVTDTGSFRYSSVNPQTHRIIAHLLELGLDHSKIHLALFDNNSYDRLKLLGYCLSEKLTVFPEAHTACFALTSEELNRYNYKKGDTEGLVNYGLSMQGINFSAYFAEHEDYVKVSFRSKGTFDVNLFARKHFNGGGHINAAGGRSDLSLSETMAKFEKLVMQNAVKIKESL